MLIFDTESVQIILVEISQRKLAYFYLLYFALFNYNSM